MKSCWINLKSSMILLWFRITIVCSVIFFSSKSIIMVRNRMKCIFEVFLCFSRVFENLKIFGFFTKNQVFWLLAHDFSFLRDRLIEFRNNCFVHSFFRNFKIYRICSLKHFSKYERFYIPKRPWSSVMAIFHSK